MSIKDSRIELTRREALKLFGASVALLQASCLERTGEEILPAVHTLATPPGTPTTFATSMVVDGYATGLLALAHTGRPTKIEGNPAHPASLGATSAQHQASILDLYDPHRLSAPQVAKLPATWNRFRSEVERGFAGDLWLLLPPDGSPAIAAQLARVRQRFPTAKVVHHARLDRSEAYRGAALAFGTPLELQLALDRAAVVVALDADVLAGMPGSLRWSHDFAKRRRTVEPGEQPVRLFVAEPALTPTGSMADRRLAIRAGDVVALIVTLADALAQRGVASVEVPAALREQAKARAGDPRWLEVVVAALLRHPRASAIVVGDRQPAAVHALAYRLTLSLGNLGTTSTFTQPALLAPLGDATLEELAAAIHGRQVGAVIALETDPVFDASADLALATLWRRVPLSATLAQHANATTSASRWALPCSHYLESWGDARALDGTRSLIQPLIQPLYDSRSRLQLLAMLAGDPAPDDRALVRAGFMDDAAWHAALAEGLVAGTAAPPVNVQARGGGELVTALATALGQPRAALELDLATSLAVGDGRFANNPWLQELPHPLTKQTWGNAALLSAATARSLGVTDGQVLAITRGNAKVEVPALIAIGHADDCITVELGYGHDAEGAPVSRTIGGNAAPLARKGLIVGGVGVHKTERHVELARTQVDFRRHHRETAFQLTLADYHARPEQLEHLRGPLPTLLAEPRRPDNVLQWAMTIDTTICTGCSSCMIACQAENNVPVVGAEGVRRGREMHWIRIDTYVEDAVHGPEVVHQPMLCQHCENAPCEYVCPTFATTHSPDGLNEMTYNRCIGTRFCSNNCPYKVRRFNWFAYDKPATIASLQHNPEVTVRARGVMEKCTYCVQRIRAAEIRGRIDGRPIAPGEVMTACQQACPTNAIQFGALQHADTDMARWRSLPRAYDTLHELGTRPRTVYLAKVLDPEGGG
ncbi:MAG: 4Fe-4S dicluster domain-containing protein [Kofleriaceae bacterium]|nr:4Fe-4S dicluster domain-containing protein [Kofleriaceae bacterium]